MADETPILEVSFPCKTGIANTLKDSEGSKPVVMRHKFKDRYKS